MIAKNVNLGNITPSFLNKNLTQFKKEINSFKEKNKIKYSDRFTEIDRDYLSAVKRHLLSRELRVRLAPLASSILLLMNKEKRIKNSE